jgi:hypothetical protein
MNGSPALRRELIELIGRLEDAAHARRLPVQRRRTWAGGLSPSFRPSRSTTPPSGNLTGDVRARDHRW